MRKTPQVGGEQRLVWMKWTERPELAGGGVFETADLEVEPVRLWTLFLERNQAVPPLLPFTPAHQVNAFIEDKLHDWMWRHGKLRYYTRVMDCSCWVLVELKEKS